MPDDLITAIMKTQSKEDVLEVGIEWCVAQSKELKEAGVPCLHYYTMGDATTTKRIVDQII
jgi:methylenetetrahydrofolate reductase (NADPH)